MFSVIRATILNYVVCKIKAKYVCSVCYVTVYESLFVTNS